MANKNNRLQETFSSQSKYCYKGTDVLINKLNILDNEKLKEIEGAFSIFKLANLHDNPIEGKFDVEHYLAIHNYLFSSIYPFAGKIRAENIQKSNSPYFDSVTPFCRPEFIYENLKFNLKKLYITSQRWKTKEEMVKDLAYYYGEINIIHPFREGNGRVEREFFRQLVYFNHLPYEIDYSKVEDKSILYKGSIYSALTMNCDLLEIFFDNCIIECVKKITSNNDFEQGKTR